MANKKLTMRDCQFKHRKPKGIKHKKKQSKSLIPDEIPVLKESTIYWAKKKKQEYKDYGYYLWGTRE
jgi:hypothetical protein